MPETAVLSSWESFYVIVGSSAAALVGLQFVVLTLIADRSKTTTKESLNAFGTPIVVHFSGALLISALMSMPWPTLGATTMALEIAGVAGFLYSVIVARRALRQREYAADREDWFWFILFPWAQYVVLMIVVPALPAHPDRTPFLIAAVVLGLLLTGIRNAWDTITYLATADHGPGAG